MVSYEVDTKPVAFVIEVRGVYNIDYAVGEETPDVVIANFANSMGATAAVNMLVTHAKECDIVIRPDDERNFPSEMGGYLMPELSSVGVCEDCGGMADHPRGECRS